jgi:HD superfamily phosphodiesterase
MENNRLKETLDAHVQRDPRLREVYVTARRRYGQFDFLHHNFVHVMRDLYRALIIAEDEGDIDYSILIPAVLLHDIGFCSPDVKRLGHDVAGSHLAQEILEELGFEERTRQAVGHCIHAHKGKATLPETKEARILYDADILEKAGVLFMVFAGKLLCEFRESIPHLVAREVIDRSAEVERGYYTRKAREIDGGRLAKVRDLFIEIQQEITVDRQDYSVGEADLWADGPPPG